MLETLPMFDIADLPRESKQKPAPPLSGLPLYLSMIPRDRLANGLKVAEPEVLAEVKATVAGQAAYRMIRRWLVARGDIPMFEQLPDRLRADVCDQTTFRGHRKSRSGVLMAKDYRRLVRAVHRLLHDAADLYLNLKPIEQRELFANLPFAPWAWAVTRKSRVEQYRVQNEANERLMQTQRDERCRIGPAARPVWCNEIAMEFPSARSAADYVRRTTGNPVKRTDIRGAIRTGHKSNGLTWRYVGAGRSLIANRYVRKVWCPVRPQWGEFDSPSKAAVHIGLSPEQVKSFIRSLEKGELVMGLPFEFVKEQAAA